MKNAIGTKIRHRREELGLSQLAVAQSIGMSRAHLTRIEGSVVIPKFDTVERIAKALRTSPASLIAA